MMRQSVLAAALITIGSSCVADDTAAPDITAATDPSTSAERSDAADSSESTAPTPDGSDAERSSGDASPVALFGVTPAGSCDALLDHLTTEALARVGPYGLEGGMWGVDEAMTEDTAAASDEGGDDSADSAAPAAAESSDAADYTNVQEAGVDEADIVKTDGDTLAVLNENRLTIIDVDGRDELATLDLPQGWGSQMFLHGDRIVVIGYVDQSIIDTTTGDAESEFVDDDISEPYYWREQTAVYDIDISDRTQPEIAATLAIDGHQLSARRVGDHIRLVTSSEPRDLPWVYPSGPAGEERAEESNREIITESTIDDWLPAFTLVVDGETTTGRLSDCDAVNLPAEFSGFSTISVSDLLLGDDGLGIEPGAAMAVLASGETIYASTDRLYVASNGWPEADETWPAEGGGAITTALHAFGTAPGEPTRYLASGSVPGTLLNQFSLDEHEGYLRVITTEGRPWEGESSSTLRVLSTDGDELVEVGSVGGLGDGEQLYSARLMGDIGFAVTFRQIDPFYVLDLADPTDPQITGELKLPGVSTYLHPVDDDHVLGVGRDVTEEGVDRGLKLSLFDVSDPANPTEVSQWTAEGYSPAEWDHRAFQMSGTTAVLPLERYDDEGGANNGAYVFDIDGGIEQLAVIRHEPLDPAESDCRELTEDDAALLGDSEIYYIVIEGSGGAFVCDQGVTGGPNCERIAADDLSNWVFEPDADIDGFVEAVGLVDDGTIELCWDDSYWLSLVQRSFFIDDTIWTMSADRLQVNDGDSFDIISTIRL